MRSRTALTMRQSDIAVYVAGKSSHYRMRMLLDCSSSRISRGDSLMPRVHSRPAAEKTLAQGPVERARAQAEDRVPVRGPSDPAPQPTRFHGTATLDAERVGRDASRIADEVIAHLSGLVGAKVTVTLEIEAEVPAGAPDHVVRTVTGEQPDTKVHEPGL